MLLSQADPRSRLNRPKDVPSRRKRGQEVAGNFAQGTLFGPEISLTAAQETPQAPVREV